MEHPARPVFFTSAGHGDNIGKCIYHRFCIGGLCKSSSGGLQLHDNKKKYQDEAIKNCLNASVRDLVTPSGDNANNGSLCAS